MSRWEDNDDGCGVVGFDAWLKSGPALGRTFSAVDPLAIGSTVTPVRETRSAAPCTISTGGETHGVEQREEAQRAAFETDSKLTPLERRAWALREEQSEWEEKEYEVPRFERRAREQAGDVFVKWTSTGRAVMCGQFPRTRTYSEIAQELGVSTPRAHQLVASAKRKGAR